MARRDKHVAGRLQSCILSEESQAGTAHSPHVVPGSDPKTSEPRVHTYLYDSLPKGMDIWKHQAETD